MFLSTDIAKCFLLCRIYVHRSLRCGTLDFFKVDFFFQCGFE